MTCEMDLELKLVKTVDSSKKCEDSNRFRGIELIYFMIQIGKVEKVI